MTQSRRELRLQRGSESPIDANEIVLHPEVLRAVAKKMRERNPKPEPTMLAKNYILYSTIDEFIRGLEGVADDTDGVIKFQQQRDTNGTEEGNPLQ